MRLDLGRVGADVGFGQGERGNLAFCKPGQVFALLFLSAKQDQRLRDADRLMRGDQRGEIAAITAEQHAGAAIVGLRKTESAILRRDLNAECAHPAQFGQDLVGDFAGPVDFVRIDFFAKEFLQRAEEGIALVAIFRALPRVGMKRTEVEMAEE